jgi:hypothetical protein
MDEPAKRKRLRPVVPYSGQIDASGGPDSVSNPGRRRSNPAVYFIVFLVLAGMGWFLVQNLMASSKLQDCMMSGRRNCGAPLDTSAVGK